MISHAMLLTDHPTYKFVRPWRTWHFKYNLPDTNTSDDKFITPEIPIRKTQSVQVL
jgi:hypothetical protein